MVPVVRTDQAREMIAEHQTRNPVLVRTGLIVGALLVLVPLGLNLRSDPLVRAADIQGLEPVVVSKLPAPAPTEVAVPLATDAPTTTLLITPVPSVPATEAVVVTAAPTDPPTTPAPVQQQAAAPETTAAPPPPAPATAAQSADNVCTSTYTIAAGDSWSAIASRAKITMKALLAANNATVASLLLPGKNICLPAGAQAPGSPTNNKPSATTQPPATTQSPATTQPAATPTTKPTPPATTAPANTQPSPPANAYSKAQVAQIIREVWPDDLEDEAIRIATRESNLIPTVRNYCCYGLFQLYYTAHRTWLASIGITNAAQLYDPRVNASAALALYSSNGWAPWATSPTTTTVAPV